MIQAPVTAAEARAIAKEAYVYGFPMVDSYRILHAYFVDRDSPEYKGPWNQIVNIPRVYTPEDKAVQTPNSDTPYSMVGLDLRTEPMVLTVPRIAKERYFSIQLIDLYTHNFDYIGSRATGNDGGSFQVAGPAWTGEAPRVRRRCSVPKPSSYLRSTAHSCSTRPTWITSSRSRPVTSCIRCRNFLASRRRRPRRPSISQSR